MGKNSKKNKRKQRNKNRASPQSKSKSSPGQLNASGKGSEEIDKIFGDTLRVETSASSLCSSEEKKSEVSDDVSIADKQIKERVMGKDHASTKIKVMEFALPQSKQQQQQQQQQQRQVPIPDNSYTFTRHPPSKKPPQSQPIDDSWTVHSSKKKSKKPLPPITLLTPISVTDAMKDKRGLRPRANSTDFELKLPSRGLCDEYSVLSSHRWKSKFGTIQSKPRGLVNLGNTCFLNATLQCLAYLPPLCQCLADLEVEGGKGIKQVTLLLRNLVRQLHGLEKGQNNEAIAPRGVVRSLPNIGRFRIGRQEDAHEFLVHLLDKMKDGELRTAGIDQRKSGWRSSLPIPRIDETTLIHRIFGGYFRSQIRCTSCPFKSNTYDPFFDLNLEVSSKDATSVKFALGEFTKKEILDTKNRWRCDKCKQLVCARKHLTVYRPPLCLIVQLKRFTFGFGGGGGGYSNFRHRFGHGGGGGGSSKISKPIEFPISLTLPLSDKRNCEYSLTGVVIHVGGSASSGHYTAYIRKPYVNGGKLSFKWFHMDDSSVQLVSEKSVLRQKDAYLLFYCRNEVKLEFPEPPPRTFDSAKEAVKGGRVRARARADSMGNSDDGKDPIMNVDKDTKAAAQEKKAAEKVKKIVSSPPFSSSSSIKQSHEAMETSSQSSNDNQTYNLQIIRKSLDNTMAKTSKNSSNLPAIDEKTTPKIITSINKPPKPRKTEWDSSTSGSSSSDSDSDSSESSSSSPVKKNSAQPNKSVPKQSIPLIKSKSNTVKMIVGPLQKGDDADNEGSSSSSSDSSDSSSSSNDSGEDSDSPVPKYDVTKNTVSIPHSIEKQKPSPSPKSNVHRNTVSKTAHQDTSSGDSSDTTTESSSKGSTSESESSSSSSSTSKDQANGNTNKVKKAGPQCKEDDSKWTVVTNTKSQQSAKAITPPTNAVEDSSDSDSDSDSDSSESSSSDSSSSSDEESTNSHSLTIQKLKKSGKTNLVPKEVSTTTDRSKSTQPSKKANTQALPKPKPKPVTVDRRPQHVRIEVNTDNILRKKNNPWQGQKSPSTQNNQNGTRNLLGRVHVGTWDDDEKTGNDPSRPLQTTTAPVNVNLADAECLRKRKQSPDRQESAPHRGKRKKVMMSPVKGVADAARADSKDKRFHRIQSSMKQMARGRSKTPSKTAASNTMKGGRNGKKNDSPRSTVKNRGKGHGRLA